ncbi:hypothetical protein [Rhodococcus koreensis]|uniref:hypothetical protein n=1 Tax=Rhodococcus koreensis TaxID=99653 RepID=UPI003671215C
MLSRNSSPPNKAPTSTRGRDRSRRSALSAILYRWRITLRWAPFVVSAVGGLACVQQSSAFGVVFYLLLGAPHSHRIFLTLREAAPWVSETGRRVAAVSTVELPIAIDSASSSMPSQELPVSGRGSLVPSEPAML